MLCLITGNFGTNRAFKQQLELLVVVRKVSAYHPFHWSKFPNVGVSGHFRQWHYDQRDAGDNVYANRNFFRLNPQLCCGTLAVRRFREANKGPRMNTDAHGFYVVKASSFLWGSGDHVAARSADAHGVETRACPIRVDPRASIRRPVVPQLTTHSMTPVSYQVRSWER